MPFNMTCSCDRRRHAGTSSPRSRIAVRWGRLALFGLALAAAGCGGGSGDGGTTVQATTSTECQAKRSTAGQDVVLLGGQSNMVGYGAYYVAALDKTDPRIKQWMRSGVVAEATEPLDHPNFPFNAGRVGPGLAFARAYLTDLPSHRSVLLVPAAQGGSGLSDNRWNPGNDLYEQAVTRALEALALAPGNCLAGILWSQGEIDAINKVPEASYRTALHTMIRSMRARLARGGNADAIPFVLGQFSTDWTGPTPTADQQAILNVINGTPSLLPTTSVASTAGLTSNLTQGLDGAIHLDAASQRVYGPRFREALKVAVANGPK